MVVGHHHRIELTQVDTGGCEILLEHRAVGTGVQQHALATEMDEHRVTKVCTEFRRRRGRGVVNDLEIVVGGEAGGTCQDRHDAENDRLANTCGVLRSAHSDLQPVAVQTNRS